jgi:hypothetical protein
MKVCNCALPSLNGNNDCCQNCGQELKVEDINFNPFPWIPDGKLLRVTSAGTNDK